MGSFTIGLRILKICLIFIFMYFSIGTYVLFTKTPNYIFPNISLLSKTEELSNFKLFDSSQNELLIREYGESEEKCLIFLSGQHGGIKQYENKLFNIFKKNNFKVFSISYPGQDGAIGQVKNISSLLTLTTSAVNRISLQCPPNKTIVYGRSLGATVAIYSIKESRISGIILESVAPSLSIAIRNYLNEKWYFNPLNILPIEQLISKNYNLKEPLSLLKNRPVSIFQGSNDSQTPLNQLQEHWTYNNNVSLHIIKGATHSNTYTQGITEIIKVANNMMTEPKS